METLRDGASGRQVDQVRGRRWRRRRVAARARRCACGLRFIAATAVMMAMMVIRTLHGLHLLLQCRERLLCFADVAGLQGIADLAQRLGKRTAALIGLRLRERRIGALRGREVAGLNRAGQLSERLPHRIDWRQNTGRGGRDWSNCHDTSPAGPSCPAWNRVARAYGAIWR